MAHGLDARPRRASSDALPSTAIPNSARSSAGRSLLAATLLAAATLPTSVFLPIAAAQDCPAIAMGEMGSSSGVGVRLGWSQWLRDMIVADLGAGPRLFVAGNFDLAGGVEAEGIAQFDGRRWSSLGGVSPGGWAIGHGLLAWDDGTGTALYAVGEFVTMPGNVAAKGVARWDGMQWSKLGAGIDGWGFALASFDDGVTGECLYVGGSFTEAGGKEVGRVARWDGSSWSAVGTGMNGPVYGLTVHDDGSGPALYACGLFTTADGRAAHAVARWDGRTWSPVGDGISWALPGSAGSSPYGLSMLSVADAFGEGPRLYLCGNGTLERDGTAGGILQWDGARWSVVGDGANRRAWAATMIPPQGAAGPRLVVAGEFQALGGAPIPYLGAWDGTAWSAIGLPLQDLATVVRVFEASDATSAGLHVGGAFLVAGSTGARCITRLDGDEWFGLGTGLSGGTHAEIIAASRFDDGQGGGEQLYFAGKFWSAGGVRASGIARRAGSGWERVGQSAVLPLGFAVLAMQPFDDGSGPSLFVGGSFSSIDGVSCPRLARWSGGRWSTVGAAPPSGSVNALTVFDDGLGGGPALVAAGDFTSISGVSAKRIARWDGRNWSPLGAGLDGWVLALAVFDDGSGPALYAAGSFANAGGEPAEGIARWDGRAWSSVGGGADDVVRTMTVVDDWHGFGPSLFAGGSFASIGGTSASRVARWDGAAWSACGDGTVDEVYASAVVEIAGEQWLYIGGALVSTGGEPARHIPARWNGIEWQEVDLGIPAGQGIIRLIHEDPGAGAEARSLYIGGNFETSAAGDSHLLRLELCDAECPADLTGNRWVDGADLAALLGAWGRARAAADFNGDGAVDGDDLGTLLGAWGACPP